MIPCPFCGDVPKPARNTCACLRLMVSAMGVSLNLPHDAVTISLRWDEDRPRMRNWTGRSLYVDVSREKALRALDEALVGEVMGS